MIHCCCFFLLFLFLFLFNYVYMQYSTKPLLWVLLPRFPKCKNSVEWIYQIYKRKIAVWWGKQAINMKTYSINAIQSDCARSLFSRVSGKTSQNFSFERFFLLSVLFFFRSFTIRWLYLNIVHSVELVYFISLLSYFWILVFCAKWAQQHSIFQHVKLKKWENEWVREK